MAAHAKIMHAVRGAPQMHGKCTLDEHVFEFFRVKSADDPSFMMLVLHMIGSSDLRPQTLAQFSQHRGDISVTIIYHDDAPIGVELYRPIAHSMAADLLDNLPLAHLSYDTDDLGMTDWLPETINSRGLLSLRTKYLAMCSRATRFVEAHSLLALKLLGDVQLDGSLPQSLRVLSLDGSAAIRSVPHMTNFPASLEKIVVEFDDCVSLRRMRKSVEMLTDNKHPRTAVEILYDGDNLEEARWNLGPHMCGPT
jgi:hypothetical protein